MTVPTSSGRIIVYWRPGCMSCASLLRQLEQREIPHDRVNIWDDDEAANLVRNAARGHETVPTVAVGPAMLVNPDIHTLLSEACEHAPAAVPDSYEPPQPGRFARWLLAKLSHE